MIKLSFFLFIGSRYLLTIFSHNVKKMAVPMKRKKNPTQEQQILIQYDLDGYGPASVSVDGYNREYVRESVIAPDELVIPEEEITIRFTYPLSTKEEFTYIQKGGFTRMDLYRCIYEGYTEIYTVEEEAVGDLGTYEMLYNRRTSDGPYGIWGHYLDDLVIEFVRYNPKTQCVRLAIGS